MRIELLPILRCPRSGSPLILEQSVYAEDQGIRSGWLVSKTGDHRYPIRDFIPRFVPSSNYADSFGMQWNKFRQTQLDSCSGHPISANRFWHATAWRPEWLAGEWVLDAGCGSGRFAEVALAAGANVVALDYSTAVDACYANLSSHPNFHAVQGNIYELPFRSGYFSHVYSLGVLQHTPDVGKAFRALTKMLAPNGRLSVDLYEKSLQYLILPKYWLRPLTKHLSQDRLFAALQTLTPTLLGISGAVGAIPLCGGVLRRFIPVADYRNRLPLNERQHREWALLDTFDWLAPAFDNPQTGEMLRRWFEDAGLKEIQVLRAGHLVGRGSMPA